MPLEDFNFDDYVKRSLENGTKEQPSELLWKRLNDQLKRNDVQHKNFMRLSIAVVSLSCLAVFVLVLVWNGSKTNPVPVTSSIKNPDVENGKRNDSENRNSTLKTTQSPEKSASDSPKTDENKPILTTQNKPLNSAKSKNLILSQNEVMLADNKNVSTQKPHLIKAAKTNQKPVITANSIQSVSQDKITESNVNTQVDASTILSEQNQPTSESNQAITFSSTGLSLLNAKWKPQTSELVKAYKRPQKSFTRMAVRLDINPGITALQIKDVNSPTPYNASYYQQNQQNNLVPNGSINFKYHAPKGFTFSTGIGLSNVVTNFDNPNSPIHYDSLTHKYEFETANGHMEVHEDEFEGEPGEPWGPGELGEPWEPGQNPPPNFHVRLQEKEVYTMLQVPVQLGYEFHFNRLKLFVQSGMVFSKTIHEKSEMYLNDNHSLREENDIDYRGIFFSHVIEMGAEYRITPHLGLSLSPNFRYFLQPLNPGADRLIYPRKYGLNFGISYYFK